MSSRWRPSFCFFADSYDWRLKEKKNLLLLFWPFFFSSCDICVNFGGLFFSYSLQAETHCPTFVQQFKQTKQCRTSNLRCKLCILWWFNTLFFVVSLLSPTWKLNPVSELFSSPPVKLHFIVQATDKINYLFFFLFFERCLIKSR